MQVWFEKSQRKFNCLLLFILNASVTLQIDIKKQHHKKKTIFIVSKDKWKIPWTKY